MRPVPQSLYDRAKLLSRVHELCVVAEIIGKDKSFVSRMKGRGWRAKAYPRRGRPTDFNIQRRHLTRKELERHYRAGPATVVRWLRESEL